jgi:hypothetical protein
MTIDFINKRIKEQADCMKELIDRRDTLDDKRYKDVYDSIVVQFEYFIKKKEEYENKHTTTATS